MTFDLLAEMERDGFSTSRKANSRSGQYNGPCILGCEGLGKDRLRVQPNYGDYGWFICEHCNSKGSGIDYLMMKRGWSKQEALKYVGWKPKDGSEPNFIIPKNVLTRGRQTTHEVPCSAWQTAGKAFVEHCVNILWSEQGQEALDYLRGRGLKDETIRIAQLGYNPTELRQSAAKWGREKHGKLWQGIVIPWLIGEDLWRITIRDEKVSEGSNRYKQVAGGSNGLYLADSLHHNRPVVITEGEIDALSVAQECGKVVSVCATGTTEGSHTAKWLAQLACRDVVFIAFDAEDKGDLAAVWWLNRLENAYRLRPWWEDANQMLQDGVDLLNDWLLPRMDSILDEKVKAMVDDLPVITEIPSDCEWCYTCLDLDKETPAVYELDGVMYCSEHHPHIQKLDAFTDQVKEKVPAFIDTRVQYWPIENSARMKESILCEYRARYGVKVEPSAVNTVKSSEEARALFEKIMAAIKARGEECYIHEACPVCDCELWMMKPWGEECCRCHPYNLWSNRIIGMLAELYLLKYRFTHS